MTDEQLAAILAAWFVVKWAPDAQPTGEQTQIDEAVDDAWKFIRAAKQRKPR